MIKKLNNKNSLDILEFINRVKDIYQDMYITKNKERIFLTDLKLIEKVLKYNEIYAIDDRGIHALLIILKEKGYRTYIKILVEKNNYIYDLFKFLHWNYNGCELFLKVKKENPITKIAQSFYLDQMHLKKQWEFCGNRGNEILLIHKKGVQDGRNRRKTT